MMKSIALLVVVGLLVSTGNAAQAQDAMVPAVVTAPVVDAGPDLETASPAPASLPEYPPPADDEMSMIRKAYYGVSHGDNKWRALATLVLIGLVYMTRRYGGSPLPVIGKPFIPPRLYAWFCTDRGGVALVFLMASMGALGHALAADVVLSYVVFENAVMVGVSAAGTYVMARRLTSPADKKKGAA